MVNGTHEQTVPKLAIQIAKSIFIIFPVSVEINTTIFLLWITNHPPPTVEALQYPLATRPHSYQNSLLAIL